MTEKEAFALVYNRLKEVPLFMGHFDAKHGNVNFMHGINTVMEFVAEGANQREEQETKFILNFTKSLKNA